MDTVDGECAAFTEAYFHAEWPNRSVYHAMVNNGSGDETVVQAILSSVRQPLSTGLTADLHQMRKRDCVTRVEVGGAARCARQLNSPLDSPEAMPQIFVARSPSFI